LFARSDTELRPSVLLRNFCNQLRLKTRLSITDVQMLSLSGVELQNRLLSDGYHMPTILIPAFPNSQIEEWVVQSGAIAFLRKPFNEDELFEHLETAIKTAKCFLLTVYPALPCVVWKAPHVTRADVGPALPCVVWKAPHVTRADIGSL
jgi:response regulator receiver domain-containing protein